jgi:glycosyltransferase involved in cell wall biosynthesis
VLAPYASGAPLHEKWGSLNIHRFKYWPGRQDCFGGHAIVPSLKRKPWLWLVVPFFIISQFLCAMRIIREYSIDVIHAHWILPQGLLAVICGKLLPRKVRIVVTSHGADVYGLAFMGPLKRWVMRQSAAITVVSRALLREVNRIGIPDSLRVRVISMGIDTSLFHPDRRSNAVRMDYAIDGPFILFVGRLTAKKGLTYLLSALPQVLSRCPTAKLIIVGDGEEREDLVRQAARLGLTDRNILFLGPMSHSDLAWLYATADVFVGPSITTDDGDREGFGLVFVEALASGCAVVATDLPAMSDIIADGLTGLVVPQRDSHALAEAVSLLLADPEMRQRIGHRGRDYVCRHFDWNIIAEKYLSALRG